MKDRSAKYVSLVLVSAFLLWPLSSCAGQSEAPAQKSEQAEYRSEEDGIDPFASEEPVAEPAKPVAAERKPLPAFTIQGLVWGALPQAIINNKVVRVGDMIDNARITGINKEGIWFSYEGQSYNLTAPGLYHSRAAINAFNPEGGTDEEQN